MAISHQLKYLSPPADVSMADSWYEIASVSHFWIRRRFEVLCRLAEQSIVDASGIAEIGCGSGLLQQQIEARYDREVTGFDLNEFALKQNVSRRSPVYCYDIRQKELIFRGHFDLIFLFDVLEHIEDESAFLSDLLFHLAPDGKLIINVPAGEWARSVYDDAAGHVRRYSIASLRDAARGSNLRIAHWSYWGMPLIPLALLRKFWLRRHDDENRIILAGFDSRTNSINEFLRLWSRIEPIPQKLIGTSLMAVLQPNSDAGQHHLRTIDPRGRS